MKHITASIRHISLIVLAIGFFTGCATTQTNNQAVQLKMKTSEGTILLEVYPDKAPITVKNFLQYVDDGFYDGTVFHRVINGFMIQGGGMEMVNDVPRPKDGIRDPIRNEASNGLKNITGSIAMARRNHPHSATSQFFINVADNANLDHPSFDGFGYTVFGRVIKGQDTVDKIRLAKTSTIGGMRDVPIEPILIKSVSRD